MRSGIIPAVLLAAVAVSGLSAQGFGISQSSQTSRLSSPAKTGKINPNTVLGSPLRLRDFFPFFHNNYNQHNVGQTVIPNPNSADYLKPFGYKGR